LTQALGFFAERPQDLPNADRAFIARSIERDRRARRRVRLFQASVYILLVGTIVGLFSWMNEVWLRDQWRWFTVIRPYMMAQVRPNVLTAEAERVLKSGDSFKECAKDCPELVVIPAGEFIMGSPASGAKTFDEESQETPQHKVVFVKPFAVGKFDVTF